MVVHSASLRRVSSILRNSCCNCSHHNILDMESKSQIIPRPTVKIHGIVLCDSIIVANNNNYLTRPVETYERDSKFNRWASNSNWTRIEPLMSTSRDPSSSASCRRCWNWCVATTAVVILVFCVVIGTLFIAGHPYFYYKSESSSNIIMKTNNTSTETYIDLPHITKVTLTSTQIKQRNANISKHAWFALQRNDARQLDSKSDEEMTFFSTSKDKVHRVPCGGPSPQTPCCKLEKSIELLELPGCRSIEVPRHKCVGGCDYVYIEGNSFVSIPQCQPVMTRRLKVKLHCGDRVRRTSVDLVSRCACA